MGVALGESPNKFPLIGVAPGESPNDRLPFIGDQPLFIPGDSATIAFFFFCFPLHIVIDVRCVGHNYSL